MKGGFLSISPLAISMGVMMALAGGCTESLAELVVVVNTDLETPDEIERV